MVSKNKYHKHTILFRGFPFKLVKKYIFFTSCYMKGLRDGIERFRT